jgi:hypothetical protein
VRVHLRENFDTLSTARNVPVMNDVPASFGGILRPPFQLQCSRESADRVSTARFVVAGRKIRLRLKNRWTNHSVGDRCCQFLPRLLGYARYVTGKTHTAAVAVSIFGSAPAPAADINAIGAFLPLRNVIGIMSDMFKSWLIESVIHKQLQ